MILVRNTMMDYYYDPDQKEVFDRKFFGNTKYLTLLTRVPVSIRFH